jgi:hypothetical protein
VEFVKRLLLVLRFDRAQTRRPIFLFNNNTACANHFDARLIFTMNPYIHIEILRPLKTAARYPISETYSILNTNYTVSSPASHTFNNSGSKKNLQPDLITFRQSRYTVYGPFESQQPTYLPIRNSSLTRAASTKRKFWWLSRARFKLC